MSQPIEIKVFVEKSKVQPQENVELYNVYGLDEIGNKYNIESFLFGAGDQRHTVGAKRK